MVFFKEKQILIRYSAPKYIRGYATAQFEKIPLFMDVQTLENEVIATPDGNMSVQCLKVFCDNEILVEDKDKQQKADRLQYQGKLFECRSCKFSKNTFLKHYVAEFIEHIDSGSGNSVSGYDFIDEDSEVTVDGLGECEGKSL